MTLENVEILKGIVFIGAIFGSFLTLFRFWDRIFPIIKAFFTMFLQPRKTQVALDSLNKKLEAVLYELRPNSGSSIKDTIDRIDIHLSVNVQRQRAMMANLADAVLETDGEGNCLWANSTYLRMVGRSLEEVQGKGWVNNILSAEREKVMEEWNTALSESREFEFEYTVHSTTGINTKVRTRTTKLRDYKGNTVGYFKVIQPSE